MISSKKKLHSTKGQIISEVNIFFSILPKNELNICQMVNSALAKGQLNSEWIYEVRISALPNKQGS